MKTKRLVIGSRSSKLAMTQAECVRDRIKEFYPALDVEIKTIKTTGDNIPDVSLDKIGDKGLFTKEIEEALLAREVDIAVHSMKDLPTELPQGLKIVAVTEREDARDCLISKEGFTIKTLPQRSRVGTGSLRRRAQLLHMRKDLNILDLRGNLDTRLKKLETGPYDAIVLAYAGIIRMKFDVKFRAISIDEILPQAGQGALGIEAREDDREAADMAMMLDDRESHLAVAAERAVLAGLGGGCQVPIGIYAEIDGDSITIKAGIFSLDGRTALRDEISGSKVDGETLGRKLAERMLKKSGNTHA